MRICVVYDCLYPWTVGGAERWLRALSQSLAAEGHEVTYLTRLQWERDAPPELPGVRVIAVSRADPLYGPDGNRLVGPPLRFGRGVLGHLLRHRDDYDVIHTCAFPYFSLLAAGLVRKRPLFVDWFEVWSWEYWREYLGGPAGFVGWAVQRACARIPQRAFTFSELHAERLRAEGLAGEAVRLAGLYAGPVEPPEVTVAREPLIVFAGRHIPEKGAALIPAAIRLAASEIPGLRGLILGDGPERVQVLAAIECEGVGGILQAPGFVAAEEVQASIASAAAMLLPSRREGYGLVVIEAAAAGTPSIVATGPDNAAVELIEPGINGVVAASDSAADLADAIVAAVRGGDALRESTAAWFVEHAERLSVAASTRQVLAAYAAAAS